MTRFGVLSGLSFAVGLNRGPRMAQKTSVFTHSLTLANDRLMVKSVCLLCGESQVVSNADDSLHQWENEHSAKHTESGMRAVS